MITIRPASLGVKRVAAPLVIIDPPFGVCREALKDEMVDVVLCLDLSYKCNDKCDKKHQTADQGDALDGRHGDLILWVLRRVRLAVRHYADDVRYGADDQDDKADEKDEVEKFVTR